MTSAAHVHAVTAEVERMKQMYPGARVTTHEDRLGTIVKVWRDQGVLLAAEMVWI